MTTPNPFGKAKEAGTANQLFGAKTTTQGQLFGQASNQAKSDGGLFPKAGPGSVQSAGDKASGGGLFQTKTPGGLPFGGTSGGPKSEGQKPIFGGLANNKDVKQHVKIFNNMTPNTGGNLLSNPSFGEIGKSSQQPNQQANQQLNQQPNQQTQQAQQNQPKNVFMNSLNQEKTTNNISLTGNQQTNQSINNQTTNPISTTLQTTIPQTITSQTTTPQAITPSNTNSQTNTGFAQLFQNKNQGQTDTKPGFMNFSNSAKQPAKTPNTSIPNQQSSQTQQPPAIKPPTGNQTIFNLNIPSTNPPPQQQNPQTLENKQPGLGLFNNLGSKTQGGSSQPQTATTTSTPLLNFKTEDQNANGQGKIGSTVNSEANQTQSTQPQVNLTENQQNRIQQKYNHSNQSASQYLKQWQKLQNQCMEQAVNLINKYKYLLRDREENYEIIQNFQRLEPVVINDKDQIQRKLKDIQQKQIYIMSILTLIENNIQTDIKPPRQSQIASQIKTCAQLSKQINLYDQKYGGEIEQDSSNQQLRNIFYNLDLVETEIKRLDHLVYHYFGKLDT